MNRQTNNKIGHRRDEKSCIEIFEISAHEKLHFKVMYKVDGLGGKWTVQLGVSGRSKAPKVDGPGSKWMIQKVIHFRPTVHF